MNKCAFLSMDSLDNFECYDHLVIEPLAALGWHAEEVSWRNKERNKQCDWNQYDLVIIRSPWDYQQDSEGFLSVLSNIEKSSAVLMNPLTTVSWNINKNYLRDLEAKGIEIVPSLWKGSLEGENFEDFYHHFATDEIIIKPCVSANADDTFRLPQDVIKQQTAKLTDLFIDRQCVIQPFMPAIINEGEYSLFYFNGQYSHAILKTPAADDFRVQEEHGGRLKKIEPESLLQELAEKVLIAIEDELLYARLDFVRTDTGFALMEAELIEPSLYFNLDEHSPKRFANAIAQRFSS